jgi:hypothetical protein
MNLKDDVIKKIQMAISLYESGSDYFKRSYDILKVSIGIILLQDSVEIFLSALCEQLEIKLKGNENFYHYIDKIEEKVQDALPLKQRIIILNKQRVNIKHFSLLPNLEDSKNYANNVWLFFSELSLRYLGKDIDSISLVDLLQDGRIKKYLKEAESSLDNCHYQDCQINCRKALYIAFEKRFDRRYIKGKSSLIDILHSEEKYQKMLDEEIFNPMDFLKKDDNKIRNQLIEMGIELIVYNNLMRLTPNMYLYEEKDKWVIEEDLYFIREYNRENAFYCLQNSIDILLRKQEYEKQERWWFENRRTIEIYGKNIILYKKASKKKGINCILKDGIKYTFLVDFRIIGLDGEDYYYSVCGNESSKDFGLLEVNGYISETDLPFDYIELLNSVKNVKHD